MIYIDMECVKHILALLLCVISIQFNGNYCQPASSNDAGRVEDEKLRSMLNSVLEQNKRLQQVWLGMEQMCKALSMPTCDCEQEKAENLTTEALSPTLHLHVMSVKSSGTSKNQTSISIKYAATPDHTTDWIVSWKNDGMWRTAGERTKDTHNPVVYISTVNMLHLESVLGIDFWLYNNDESFSIRLNVTAMESHYEQNVAKPYVDFFKINKSFVAPKDTDLIISGVVNRDTREFRETDYVEVHFTGFNTSANPPTIFQITQFDSDGLAVTSGRYNNTISYFNITLGQPFVQYGGLLSVRMSFFETEVGMVERKLYSPLILIYGPDGKNVIQNNTIGLFPPDAQTVVFSSNHSVICAAMGNPRPEVSVFKLAKKGKKTKMATETVILDNYTNVKVMTLSANQTTQIEGQYLCQATNGNQTMNATTDVIVLEPAMFDDTKTGVAKNTSQSIVISCKAKGSPRPHLELKLYEEYGPDLVKSGMYKFRRSSPNTFTTRVTLTISPVDDSDIHTVYCVSTQGGPTRPYEDSRPIYVYPGVQKRYNWDLYDRVFNATQKAYIAV